MSIPIWFHFEDWGAPNPDDPGLGEALHTARYDLANLTQTQAYRICEAAEAYRHFAGHVAPNRLIVPQLQKLRARVRQQRALDPDEKEGT